MAVKKVSTDKKNLHEGHRERMRKRFKEGGFAGFAEHEILEFLLFFVYRIENTNEIGHKIMLRFGSLDRVFKASMQELMEVEGVGEKSALLLATIGETFRALQVERTKGCCLEGIDERCEYFRSLLSLEADEVFMIACLNDTMHVIHNAVLAKGTPGSVTVCKIDLVRLVASSHCNRVMIAHNHPNGLPIPSINDMETTRFIAGILKNIDIELVDHVIVGENGALSMMNSGGYIPNLW